MQRLKGPGGGVRKALADLKGPSAIVVLSQRHPDRLIAARLGNAGGVVVGYGEGEMYIASDIPAILRHTRRLAFLESRQMAIVTAGDVAYFTLEGQPLSKEIVTIEWNAMAARRGVSPLHAERDFRAGAQPDRHIAQPARLHAQQRGVGNAQPVAGTGAQPE
jgi:glucosamine 6-phosphate synthetase-like amidotransferase/phosphosugar isomerase protein